MTPSSAPFLKVRAEGIWLALKVQPRASANEVAGEAGNELKIRITAPPVDSAANQALVDFLVAKLGCRRGAIQIVRGHCSRHKIVSIAGLTADEVFQRLGL